MLLLCSYCPCYDVVFCDLLASYHVSWWEALYVVSLLSHFRFHEPFFTFTNAQLPYFCFYLWPKIVSIVLAVWNIRICSYVRMGLTPWWSQKHLLVCRLWEIGILCKYRPTCYALHACLLGHTCICIIVLSLRYARSVSRVSWLLSFTNVYFLVN